MTQELVLYRKSGKKILSWTCEIVVSDSAGKWRTISGEVSGKLTTSAWKVGKEKNLGKANASTGSSQALLDMEAAYRKKLGGDYHMTEAEAQASSRFKPMLAHTYGELNKKQQAIFEAAMADGSIVGQPKLDGFRCNTGAGFALISRGNKPFLSCPHVTAALVATGLSDKLVIDGELYGHEEEFEELSGMIRKATLDEEALARTKAGIFYHIYDCFDPEQPEQTYETRMAIIRAFVPADDPVLRVLTHASVATHVEAKEMHDRHASGGFEGLILRHLGMPYENKRSFGLLKYKQFDEAEFPIVAIEEGDGNRAGMAGRVIVDLGDDGHCGCGMRGNVPFRKEVWAERAEYIGGTATVRFFGRTANNQLRHGVTKVPLFKENRDV